MSSTDRRSRWLSRMARPEPPSHARGLALVCVATGALWLYTAAFPAIAGDGAIRHGVDGALAIAAGALCWSLATRFRTWMLHVAVGAGIASGSLALAEAATPVGSALAIGPLLWICVYVGAIHPPTVARVYAAGLGVGLGAGLLGSEVPDAGIVWAPLAAAFALTAEILSRTVSRLRRDAVTDPLTRLRNRHGALEAGERALSTCRRAGADLTVAQIDLDGFKAVNDRAGHLEGDRLLRRCADAWRSELRAGDVLARVGGDEFVLVLPGTDRTGAVELLERLRARSPAAWSYGTATLGPRDSIESCVARADADLYAAKRRRKRAARERAVARLPRALPAATVEPAG